MNAVRWILLAPFKLAWSLVVALGYLLAFVAGLGLVGGGTALTLSGAAAIIGVPAIVLGVLVLAELFDGGRRAAPQAPVAPQPLPAAIPEVPPPAACACSWHGARRPAAPHYRPRPQYAWVPGRWTVV